MINHALFTKGTTVYVLLHSGSFPNILIPVKAKIKEVIFDNINPQYSVKVLKFYESFTFINKYFLNMKFSNSFNNISRKLNLNNVKLKIKNPEFVTVSDISERLDLIDEEDFYIKIDSMMAFKFKQEMMSTAEKINDHLIEIKFKELREFMTRNSYKGRYGLDSHGEFHARLKKFIGDKISEADIDFTNYTRLL